MISNVCLDTKKILRDIDENNLLRNDEKIIKFKYKSSITNGSKIFNFYGVDSSLVTIVFRFYTLSNVNVKIKFNNISIFENTLNSEEKIINKNKYINSRNSICIEHDSDSNGEICFEIEIKGCVNKMRKMIPKCIFFLNNFNILNERILSKSNQLLSTSNIMYDNGHNVCDNSIDINVNYFNNTNNQEKLNIIYIDNDKNIILKNSDNEKIISIENVNDLCLLSSNDYNLYYKFIYLSGGKLSLVVLDYNFNFVNSSAISSLNYIKIKRIKSIVADVPNNYFWAQSIDDIWYLICIQNDGSVLSVFPYKKCDDVVSYFLNSLHYVLSTMQYGLLVEKMLKMDNFDRLECIELKNVEDAIIHDNSIYILNDNFVQRLDV